VGSKAIDRQGRQAIHRQGLEAIVLLVFSVVFAIVRARGDGARDGRIGPRQRGWRRRAHVRRRAFPIGPELSSQRIRNNQGITSRTSSRASSS
jgi:hypothetical protein